jgi:hypothetical protein
MKNITMKTLLLTSLIPAGCGEATANCFKPTSNKPFFPYNAFYINSIDGDLSAVVDETIGDLETRTGETFMHAAPVADMDIKIKFGDLDEKVIGQAETWSNHCRITMSNTLKKEGYWSKYDFAAVLRHEIGHCFGMDHDDDPTSIMYWQYDPTIHRKNDSINAFVIQLRNFRQMHN